MKKRILGASFLIIIIILQLHMLRLLLNYTFYGIQIEKMPSNHWEISGFDPAIEKIPLGLKIGDIIEEVDSHSIGTHKTIKWKVVEQFKNISILRDGDKMDISASRHSTITKADIQSISGEIIAFIISILVIFKIRNSKSAILLSIVFVTIGITFMSFSPSVRADSLAKLTIGTSLIAIPSVFLHFLLVFFKEKGNITSPNIPLKYIYALPTIFIFWFLGSFWSPKIFERFFLPYGDKLILLCFILGTIVNFIVLTKVFINHRRKVTYESFLVKTIWVSLCISFIPIIFLSLIPSIFFSYKTGFIPPAYSGLFVMFFPASFAYLIGSKQLYDIHLVIRRVTLASMTSIIPSFFIIVLIKLGSHDIANDRLLLMFFIIIIIFTMVLYFLEYFTTIFEPIIFPKKHYLQKALKSISKKLTTVSSFLEFRSIILVDIVATLQVLGGAIVFRFQEDFEIISVGQIDEADVKGLLLKEIREHTQYSIFKINQNEEYETFLVMTRKRTNTLLGLEETQWLNLIISYLAVSLENIHLIRKLTSRLQHLVSNLSSEEMAKEVNWFRKLLFQLQEKERVRIATDLHDTTIQDLYFLKRRLMELFDQFSVNPESGPKMKNILEYIEIMNTNLRNSCFELNPYLLKESGLVETLQKLISHEKMISDFSIDYFPLALKDIESLSLDAKRHVFRIVQELINNAKKHAQAKTLFLELNCLDGLFELHYEDDGIGFDANQLQIQDVSGQGIGMEQMRSRVYSLDGTFELETARGKGVKLKIAFPMKEGKPA